MKISDFFSSARRNAPQEAKQYVPPLISYQFAAMPAWSTRNFASLVRSGYLRNPVVYRCVRLISEAVAAAPWIIEGGSKADGDHPALRLLAKPNVRQTGAAFLEALVGYHLLAGTVFVELVSLDAQPRELHILRPDRVKLLHDKHGWLQGYTYQVGATTIEKSIPADAPAPLVEMKQFHPLEDHAGFSPLEAAQTSTDMHNQSAHWNKSLLDNSARPSGALIYQPSDGMPLNAQQYDRLKQELEAGFTGPGRAGRPMLLEGGLDWRAMSLTPKDMDFRQSRDNAAREIALCFGVPPQLLGIPGDSTYANYAEANRAFIKQTILPLLRRMAQTFSTWLGAHYQDGTTLSHDFDAVEGNAADRDALWARIAAADFLTEQEKRAAVGYGPKHDG